GCRGGSRPGGAWAAATGRWASSARWRSMTSTPWWRPCGPTAARCSWRRPRWPASATWCSSPTRRATWWAHCATTPTPTDRGRQYGGPVFAIGRPSEDRLARVLAAVAGAPFTYPEVGATAEPGGALPPGYHHVRATATIGSGDADFASAVDGVRGWRMHRGQGFLVVPDAS